MKPVLLVFLGGGLGSVLRFSVGKWIGTLHTHYFPFGTLAANVIACVALGFLVGFTGKRLDFSMEAKLFWTVGFCGGFSTFSTFSLEAISLFQTGYSGASALYIAVSLTLCILATIAGISLGQSL